MNRLWVSSEIPHLSSTYRTNLGDLANHEWQRSTIACCALATICLSSSASTFSCALSHSSCVNPGAGGDLPPPSPCCFLYSSHERPARSPHHLTAPTKSSPSARSTYAYRSKLSRVAWSKATYSPPPPSKIEKLACRSSRSGE